MAEQARLIDASPLNATPKLTAHMACALANLAAQVPSGVSGLTINVDLPRFLTYMAEMWTEPSLASLFPPIPAVPEKSDASRRNEPE